MTEQPSPEQGIQAGAPAAATPNTDIQANPPTPDTITLPPLPPAPDLAPLAAGWSLFDFFLLLLLITLVFFFGSFTANNSDFWMHLATGRDLLNGSHQLGVDPYSFATQRDGQPVPWVNHSWLYDIGLYCLYQSAGGAGVVIFHALLGVASLLVLVTFCAPESSRPATLLMAGLTMLVVSQRMPLNSIFVSYLLLGVLLALLRRGGGLDTLEDEQPSARALWAVPILFALWVNLDGWFILGIVALTLIVVGNAVVAILGRHSSAAAKQQVLVLLASFAACLLNPFHVRAFTLPPELAYALGGWLPSALGGGGDTLRSLAQFDPDNVAGSSYGSPFRPPFAPFTALAFSIDKVAYFVLAPLAVLSAPLVVVAATSEKGPRLPLGRLLVLAMMTVFGLMQVRLIPLFAALAGPIAMLNFTEFAQWLRRRPNRDPEGGFNPNLARLATAVLFVVALILAWPGWLHSRIMANSYRRVAWEVLEDPSLKATAQTLKEQAKNVFNFSPDITNYCAWFAPGVHCYVDQRYGLFAHEAARYGKAKKALRDDAILVLDDTRKAPRGEWRETFRTHQIDHLAVSRFASDIAAKTVSHMCWWHVTHWTQRYGDGHCLIFRWSPDGSADPMVLAAELNKEAFDTVPEARRAPRDGVDPVQPSPTLESLFLERIAPLAARSGSDSMMNNQYFQLMHRRWTTVYDPTWLAGMWCVPAGLGGAAPNSVLWYPTFFYSTPFYYQQYRRSRDNGPPAVPVLMIRQARRAVKEQPQEANSYLALYFAYTRQSQEMEDHWFSGSSKAKSDRTLIRHMQSVAALRSYLELRPDDWEMRRNLALFYQQEFLYDAGLQQVGLVLKSIEKERRQARDARTMDMLKQQEKDVADFYKRIELEVKRRRNDFDIQSGKKKPIEKFAIAVLLPYKTVNQMNQDVYESSGMGLALEGLKQLESIPAGSLAAEEQALVNFHRFRLLMLLGQVGEANAVLAEIGQGPQSDQPVLWYAATMGAYELADQMLGNMEKMIERQEQPLSKTRANFIASAASRFAGGTIAAELPPLVRWGYASTADMSILRCLSEYQQSKQIVGGRAGWRTLRGLFALEVGDTARAEQHFAEALRSASAEVTFGDRRIAERYLEILREQKK